MNDDQLDFLAAMVGLLMLIVVLSVAYLIGVFAFAEYGRPSVSKIASLEGKPSTAAVAELNEMEIDCKKDADQPEPSKWTCWGDEATIAGPCHWNIEISANATGIISKVEFLKATGQCKK